TRCRKCSSKESREPSNCRIPGLQECRKAKCSFLQSCNSAILQLGNHMDGLFLVDKPVGPTSHDVVARVRRVLGERRIGHTGTLDPMASGVLPLVIGTATRLAQFLSVDIKRYDATIRLGFATDTYDAVGHPTTAMHAGPMPTRDRIEEALAVFRGTFTQQPPAFSAKKIDGKRSYRLARV